MWKGKQAANNNGRRSGSSSAKTYGGPRCSAQTNDIIYNCTLFWLVVSAKGRQRVGTATTPTTTAYHVNNNSSSGGIDTDSKLPTTATTRTTAT